MERRGRVPPGIWNPLSLSVAWQPTGAPGGPMALRPRLTTGLPFRGELADAAAAQERFRFHVPRSSATVSAKP